MESICSTCEFCVSYRTGFDEYPAHTTLFYCAKGHWENATSPNLSEGETDHFADCEGFYSECPETPFHYFLKTNFTPNRIMKTKEQILQDHVDKDQLDSLGENVWPDILEAMELYRNQPSGEGVKSPEEYIDEAEKYCDGPAASVKPTWKRIARTALTAQARDYEREMEAFCEWLHRNLIPIEDNSWKINFRSDYEIGPYTKDVFTHSEIMELFRNDRSKPKDHEIEHECATCHKDISKWGFCPDCDTQANSR